MLSFERSYELTEVDSALQAERISQAGSVECAGSIEETC